MKQPQKRKRTLLAFLPAAIVIGVVGAAAAGISLIPSATASTVQVSGTVDATIDTPATATDGANTGTVGTPGVCANTSGNASWTLVSGWESAAKATGNCTIDFGSSTGAIQMTYENNDAAFPGFFYCNHPGGGARSCAAAVDRVGNVAPGSAIGVDQVGIALNSTPTNTQAPATGVATDADNNALTGDPSWYPIPNNGSPAELCQTSAAGPGKCVIRLAVRGKGAAPAQDPGHYDGTLLLTAAQI